MDFGTIFGAVGRRNRKKGDPETLTKSYGKKVTQEVSGRAVPGGGGCP